MQPQTTSAIPATSGFSRAASRRNILSAPLASISALALFFIAATILTWPRVPGLANSVVDYGDPLHHIWRLDWIDRTLFSNYSRLYDAPIYHGFPLALAYDDIFIGPALSVLVLTALTQNIDLSYNIFIVLEFVLAAWCTFLLARHLTKSALGGLFAGMVVAFTSYTFAHLSHANLLALYPMPLALLCLHQVFDAPKHSKPGGNRLLVAGLWTVAFLSCALWQALHSFYYAAYLALAAGALVLWEWLVVRRWHSWPGRWRASIAGMLALAFAFYVVGVWLLSGPNRAVQQEFGFRRSLQDQVNMSALITDYFAVSSRNETYYGVLPKVDLDQALFPGFISLVLGTVGAGLVIMPRGRKLSVPAPQTAVNNEQQAHEGTAIRAALSAAPDARSSPVRPPSERPRVAFYLLLALIGVLLSLGPIWDTASGIVPMPYQLLWSLPGFEGLRGPRRLAVLALVGWGVLAAWGWRSLSAFALDWTSRRSRKSRSNDTSLPPQSSHADRSLSTTRLNIAGAIIAVLLLVMMGVEQWTVPTPSVPLPPPPEGYGSGGVPPAYNWLASQADDGVLMEFPVQAGNALREFPVMYYQQIHRHPLENGLSSYQPEMYRDLMLRLDIAQDPLAGFDFTSAQIGMLQSLEVRYLLFNELAYKTRHWQQIQQSLATYPEVTYAGKHDLHHIYTLSPLADEAQLRLGVRVPPTMQVGASVPVTLTVVNPYAYMLLSRLQPSLGLVVNWQRKEKTAQTSGQDISNSQIEPAKRQPAGDIFAVQSAHFNSLLGAQAAYRTELSVDTDLLITQGAHLFNIQVEAPSEPGEYLLQIYPKWRLPIYKLSDPLEMTITATSGQ